MLPALVDDEWLNLTPRDVSRLMVGFRGRWWIAGGWALDLYLGGEPRPHADMDISCFRQDVPLLRDHLKEWEFFAAVDGALEYMHPTAPVSGHVHTLWARECGTRTWGIEVMIEDSDGPWWIFRRDPEIRRLKDAIVWQDANGRFIVRPEMQLLYKAKDARLRDQSDFERSLAALTDDARTWLADSLRKVHPGHSWLDDLENG